MQGRPGDLPLDSSSLVTTGMKRKKLKRFDSSENELMHDLNPYKKEKPDFKDLCERFPKLSTCV